MKQILKISILLIAIFAIINEAYSFNENIQASSSGGANKIGTAGGQFLKIATGARGVGMGGAYSSVTNDLSSIYWNPAGIADIKTISAEFSYTQWFATYSHSFAAASMPLGPDFTLAAHLISLSSGDIQVTTLEGFEGNRTYYQVNDMSLGFTFAGYLTEQFSFGVTAKYINNSLYNVSSNGFAFDIGTMYNTNIYGIKIGFSIHNLGTETAYEGQGLRSLKKYNDASEQAPLDVAYIAYPYSYPLIFRAGLSSEVYKQDDHKIIAAFDFSTFSDVPEQYAIGAEYTYKDFVALRLGYQISQDEFGFSAGVGIKYEGDGFGGKFDYSINPTANLGLVNRFTVGVNF
jgi:hypothetical protein